MQKYVISIFPIVLAAMTSSCGSDESSIADAIDVITGDDIEIGSDGQGTSVETDTDGNAIFTVGGFGETAVVNNPIDTNLSVTGSNNTVTVETDLDELVVNGSNNQLIFSAGVSVASCIVAGSDNTAQTVESLMLVCEVTGSGNIGFGEI